MRILLSHIFFPVRYLLLGIFSAGMLLTAHVGLAQQTEKVSTGISGAQQEPTPIMNDFSTSSDELLSSPTSQTSAEFIPTIARRAAAEGNTAFVKGNFKNAVRAYQEVLQLAPNNLVGLVNLGLSQYRLGDIASAEKNLKHAIALRLETGVAWFTLGTIYMDQGRLDEALAALTQARLYDSKNSRIHNYLGVVMNRMGWSDAAESELRTAVELDTAYSDAHYNLAVVYMDRNPPAMELAKRHYYLATQYGAKRDVQMENNFKSFTHAPSEISHSSQ